MVKIELSTPLKDFKGQTLTAGGSPPTIKDLLLHYLGTFRSKDGKRILEAYRLGMRIAEHKEAEIQLENAEFLLLKEAIQIPQHGALVTGQIHEALDQAAKTKTTAAG